MTPSRQTLDQLIDAFLGNATSLEQFQREYSDAFTEGESDTNFSEHEVRYYGDVHEKAEWTSASPTLEEQDLGWMDEQRFRGWLVAQVGLRRGLE